MTPISDTAGSVRQRLYSSEELQPLISPKSIAIIGASSAGKGFGASAQRQLLEAHIGRPLYLIHPRFAKEKAPEAALGVASIADLPRDVDCLLIAVPADAVEGVIREAAGRGCKSAIIFSAGFGETEGGAAAEARLRALAIETGMRLGGPNTAGVLNYRENLPLTFVPDLRMDLPSGNLAIVSQSAGLATHLGHRRNRGLGVSYTITTGNSVDVTAFDYVNFLLDDPATDVVLLVIEGLDNPTGLAEIGRKSRRVGKPILALKTGRTQTGGRAAVSHTGSLAGSYDVFQAAADAAGIMLFKTTEELIETGQLFARWAGKPYVPGGVGILTTMGGPGVMSADAADDENVPLPAPSARTLERLGQLIPSFAAFGNPIDTTASPTDDVLRQCLEAIADDEGYSAGIILAASQTGPSTAKRPASIVEAVRNSKKPIAAVWLSSWLECPGSEILDAEPGLPVFRSSDRCLRAVRHWMNWNERPRTAQVDRTLALSAAEAGALSSALSQARSDEARSGALSEAASREVLAALGLRMPGAEVATSREQAAAAAKRFGFPVVAKIVSADVPHKAAAGGVKLNLGSETAVGDAFEQIMRDVHAHVPKADLKGVLIVEMVRGGTEFMCGLVRDPVFGPVILCGAGGGAVEELKDVGRCVAPVTESAARRALHSVRAFQSLQHKHPAKADQLETQLIVVMQKLGAAALIDASISEIDINPVVQSDDGTLVALDALVVLA
ncbi:MAG: putative acetyl-CoA synthetase [Hydrocarboniphaga sp.]|uniref:acetate--CoA ligase family protein n=1 Tax=Hydrocarboniphaga sp. TaxID=2033016 RepID=UPI002615C8AC|nr:acetate--CoA ligase family protein [Hydrocarboniphaga sp.]MDB5970017.1 putative acetyl-CoA synthetase [Hydrocarboniphaga sp.]